MPIIVQVLKENWFEHHGFAHSQTTSKLVNEAAKDSAWISRQDRKIPPALRTNQIAGFGGFRPLTSLKKNELRYYVTMLIKSFVKLQIGLLPTSCH